GLGTATAVVMWLQARCFAAYLARSRRFAPRGLVARVDPPCWGDSRGLLATRLASGVTDLVEGGHVMSKAAPNPSPGAEPGPSSPCSMAAMALAEATTVRVGRALGAGDPLGVRRAARAGYPIVLATQACSALVMLLGHDAIVAIYTRDAAVAATASVLLLYAAT